MSVTKNAASEAAVAERLGAKVRALSSYEWDAVARSAAYVESKKVGAQIPVRFHPSKLPFLTSGRLEMMFNFHHLRTSYGRALATWGAAVAVAAWYFTDRSLSDFVPNTTAGFWSLLPGWQSSRVNNRQ